MGLSTQRADQRITLDEQESRIFDTLLAAREHAGLSTTLRCAGGWVRDKLLARESKDIDIALDNISGKEFAAIVNAYLEAQGEPPHKVGIIEANPDQSKHLETATLRVHGVMLDFVNLRSETYTETSRIPVVDVGTPLQDAERRDFTINSLFYNLNTRAIEDLTGKGLRDLRDGVIRTPLDPNTTFRDDPLRVLRGVRFASRYAFRIGDDILAAAASKEVHDMLDQKIARERIGTEIAGCLEGPNPVLAMQLLNDMRAFTVVFEGPESVRPLLGPRYGRPCVAVLEHARRALTRAGLQALLQATAGERRVGCAAALLLPLRCAEVPWKKKRSISLSKYILLHSLKWRTRDADDVQALHEALPDLCEAYESVRGLNELERLSVDATADTRVCMGHTLSRLRGLTPMALALFPLLYLPDAAPLAARGAHQGDRVAAQPELDAAALQHRSELLAGCIAAWGLERCYEWPPLLDGRQMVEVLDMEGPGPMVGPLMKAAREWQFKHASNDGDVVANDAGATLAAEAALPPELVLVLQDEYARLRAREAAAMRG